MKINVQILSRAIQLHKRRLYKRGIQQELLYWNSFYDIKYNLFEIDDWMLEALNAIKIVSEEFEISFTDQEVCNISLACLKTNVILPKLLTYWDYYILRSLIEYTQQNPEVIQHNSLLLA